MDALSLGFDLRMRAADYAREVWSPEHRASYLLREDIEWPMSVDRAVWPSLLQSHYFDARANRKANPRFLGQDASDSENEFGLLRDLASIARFHGVQDGISIGVQLIYNERKETDPFIGIEASAVPAKADILGFDVATPAPISGLSNCGYTQEEVQQLRAEWGHRLNVYGLLESVDHAVQFREMTNKRVPEHAPFYVYKLFRVEPAAQSAQE
jgi:hypothetical protein